MDKRHRTITQVADKYARNKEHNCLFPGCKKKAIRSHAIPRASIIEALADKGVVYTQRQSFNPSMKMTSLYDPPDIEEIGVNNASTFKGYCPEHDARLFASAETTDVRRKNGMFISLHMRALSLECCRKRRNADFFQKSAELATEPKLQAYFLKSVKIWNALTILIKDAYLGSVFALIGGSFVDSINYYCVPFSRNLQVSCCGVFNETSDNPKSVIAYNLISYAEMSILVLTIFKVQKEFLDAFLSAYSFPDDLEKLVNDVAFTKCEEPLISARLWRSLSFHDKLQVRLSLRYPDYQGTMPAPRIIKIKPSDLASTLTPEMLTRLPPDLARTLRKALGICEE